MVVSGHLGKSGAITVPKRTESFPSLATIGTLHGHYADTWLATLRGLECTREESPAIGNSSRRRKFVLVQVFFEKCFLGSLLRSHVRFFRSHCLLLRPVPRDCMDGMPRCPGLVCNRSTDTRLSLSLQYGAVLTHNRLLRSLQNGQMVSYGK